jgi:murein DD-endopeptidase MepM/ murein hydrolase activator NlpD
VTESPLSGYSPDYDAYGYDAYSTGAYPNVNTAFADDATGTYGYIPQQATAPAQPPQQYESYGHPYDQAQAQPSAHTQAHAQAGMAGPAGTQQTQVPYQQPDWDSGAYPAYGYGYDQTGTYAAYDPYAYGDTTTASSVGAATYYDTGTYDTSALWQNQSQQPPQAPAQDHGQQPQTSAYPQADWDSGAYPAYGYGYGYGYDSGGDTGIYEQVQPGYGYPAAPAHEVPGHEQPAPAQDFTHQPAHEADHTREFVPEPVLDLADQLVDDMELFAAEFAVPGRDTEPDRHDYAADGGGIDGISDGFRGGPGGGEPVARSRRRKPAKRSALLTVAVPSVAVMGVAAVGAAAVAGVGMTQDPPKTQADGQAQGQGQDTAANAPTTQLDRQLAGVSKDASDFADRASRTQERIDLKDRQEAAKKAAAAAAARKEALRPKFLLPVKQKGLSAYFGQAGVNWMALHTGIDFPVQVGTPVTAVTDGTVRTQWNSSYGNMAIVTAPDGTETWYCHLSSTKIRSGKVKAGDVIAYSGNTGNTTGPHLHLEVRPGGGAPIDPLPWLLAHGLDPR